MSERIFEKEKCENFAMCKQLIQSVIDGSATEEEVASFKNNLTKCKPCYETYELEKAIKDNHLTKVEKVCCPKKTIELLKQKLGLALSLVLVVLLEIKIFVLMNHL